MNSYKHPTARTFFHSAVLISTVLMLSACDSITVSEPTETGSLTQQPGGGNGNGNSNETGTPAQARSAVYSSDSQLTLEWIPDETADSYNIYYSENATFDALSASLLNETTGVITGTSAAITNLNNGTTYYTWAVPVVSGVEGTPVLIGDGTPTPGGFSYSVQQMQPPMNSVEFNTGEAIRIPFSEALAPSTVNGNTVTVEIDGVAQAATVSLIDSGQTIEITPDSGEWQTGSTHVVTLAEEIESQSGEPLPNALTYTFSTLDTASLVAWWEFDNDLSDKSGNANTID
ncbi:MAG: Ig-like domain-containing protein, partial [Granulosicoccaceae bacterium]